MSTVPHRLTRLFAVGIGASLLGGTAAGVLVEHLSLGAVLVTIALAGLILAGVAGVLGNEPVLAALSALGLVFMAEALSQLTVVYTFGAIGYLIAGGLATAEVLWRRRRATADG